MIPRKFRLKIFVTFLALFSLIAEGKARTVKVGIPAHNVTQIALYVAREKGYYQQEGLEVKLVLMAGPIANMALMGGEVEFTTVPTAGLTAALRGAPLRILFSSIYRPLFWLYVRPEIREVKALKGKRVGVAGIAAATGTLLLEILDRHGLEGGRDVVILSLGTQPNVLGGLQSGSVDAAVFGIPFNFRAKEAGFRELVSFVERDLVLLGGSIVVREGFLHSDSALVEKFIRATLKGHLYARENRAACIPILVRNLKINEGLAAKIYDLAQSAMTPTAILNKDLQEKFVKFVAKARGVKKSISFERFFDFTLLEKAKANLEAEAWKPTP